MKIVIPRLRLKKKNGYTLGLLFVVAAIENFAYLVPANEVFIYPFKFSDIGFFSAAIWSVFVFVNSSFRGIRKIKLPIVPALFFVVWFFSSRVNKKMYGQSYLDSFIRSRRLLLAIILMYAIIIALRNGMILFSDVLTILFMIGIAEVVIDIMQFLLSEYLTFTYYQIGERYSSARVRAAYLLPLIVGYFALDNFLNRKHKEFNAVVFGGAVFLLMGICKHRAPSLILICTMGIAYLLWKKNFSNKILIGILILTIGIPVILRLPIVQDSFSTAVSTSASVNSLIIRSEARAYYLREIVKSPIFGFGISYRNNKAGIANGGMKYGYIREDNGIWGFLYSHGLVGVIWVLLLLLVCERKALYLYKNKGRYAYVLYFLYEIANLYMGMHWYYDYQYPMFIIMALLEYEYMCLPKEDKQSFNYSVIWKKDMCKAMNNL